MDSPPPLNTELVHEFVQVAHANFERVVELLAQAPALANAVWDWGGGDFESALGAAAHMGRRDIALHLLAHGARFDMYAAAMLGQLELVRAILEAQPELRSVPGAHGIPLIVHAQKGGEEAKAVLAYPQSQAPAA
jgi:hypothetical protein